MLVKGARKWSTLRYPSEEFQVQVWVPILVTAKGNFLFYVFLYISEEMINKLRWDVFHFEGLGNTFLYSRVWLHGSQSCLPVSCTCQIVHALLLVTPFRTCPQTGLCCGSSGSPASLGSVVASHSWMHPKNWTGHNPGVRKSSGLQMGGEQHVASLLVE